MTVASSRIKYGIGDGDLVGRCWITVDLVSHGGVEEKIVFAGVGTV